MILVTEKKTDLASGKKTNEKYGFSNLSHALHRAAEWVDNCYGAGCNGVAVVVWEKKIKFGFYASFDSGYQEEIAFEEILDRDPDY